MADSRPLGRLPNRVRRGFTLLEFEVAMLVFGVALAGIFPLVVVYSRGLELLEKRSPVRGEWYLTPSADPWAQKLGAAASLTKADSGLSSQSLLSMMGGVEMQALEKEDAEGGATPENDLQILALTRSSDSESVTARVLIVPQ